MDRREPSVLLQPAQPEITCSDFGSPQAPMGIAAELFALPSVYLPVQRAHALLAASSRSPERRGGGRTPGSCSCTIWERGWSPLAAALSQAPALSLPILT